MLKSECTVMKSSFSDTTLCVVQSIPLLKPVTNLLSSLVIFGCNDNDNYETITYTAATKAVSLDPGTLWFFCDLVL